MTDGPPIFTYDGETLLSQVFRQSARERDRQAAHPAGLDEGRLAMEGLPSNEILTSLLDRYKPIFAAVQGLADISPDNEGRSVRLERGRPIRDGLIVNVFYENNAEQKARLESPGVLKLKKVQNHLTAAAQAAI